MHDYHGDYSSDAEFDFKLALVDRLPIDISACHHVDADEQLEEPDDEGVLVVRARDPVGSCSDQVQSVLVHLFHES